MAKASKRMWTLPELAALWRMSERGVRYYVDVGLLNAWHHAPGKPYYVTESERIEFETNVRPTIKAGPTPKAPRPTA